MYSSKCEKRGRLMSGLSEEECYAFDAHQDAERVVYKAYKALKSNSDSIRMKFSKFQIKKESIFIRLKSDMDRKKLHEVIIGRGDDTKSINCTDLLFDTGNTYYAWYVAYTDWRGRHGTWLVGLNPPDNRKEVELEVTKSLLDNQHLSF